MQGYRDMAVAPTKPIIHTRSCDYSPTPNQVLCDISETFDSSRSCVFNEIADRIPVVAKEWLEQARPHNSDHKGKTMESNRVIRQWLDDNKDWIFSGGASCKCIVHKRDCLAHFRMPHIPDDSELSPPEGSRSQWRITCGGVTCLPWSSEGILPPKTD